DSVGLQPADNCEQARRVHRRARLATAIGPLCHLLNLSGQDPQGAFVNTGPAQLLHADLCAAARLCPVNGRTAVLRSSQRLGDNTVAKANPEGLANTRWPMHRCEDAPVADANSAD